MDQRFTIDAYFALNQLTDRVPFALSPDGQKLVFTMQQGRQPADRGGDDSYTSNGIPRGMVGSRVQILDTTTGAVENPFPAPSTTWGAQWSPDGSKLAAYVQDKGPACLGIWECATSSFKRYPQVAVRPFFGFEVPQWVGQTAVIVKLVATATSSPRERASKHHTSSDQAVTVFTFPPAEKSARDTAPLPGWADGYVCNLGLVDLSTGNTTCSLRTGG